MERCQVLLSTVGQYHPRKRMGQGLSTSIESLSQLPRQAALMSNSIN